MVYSIGGPVREKGVPVLKAKIMSRPDRLNAVTPEMFKELKGALDEVNNDDGVRVAILAGAGYNSLGGSLARVSLFSN